MTTSHNAPNVLEMATLDDPSSMFRTLRQDFPVLYHEESGYWFLSRHADVASALGDETSFSTRHQEWQLEPVIGRSLGAMTGREHSTHRALVTPSFRGKMLADTFVPIIESIADDLLGKLDMSEPVDLVKDFSKWLPISVIAEMLALPSGDRDRFYDWYSSFMAYLSNITQDPEVTAWGDRTKVEYPDYMMPIITKRRETPGDDLLSVLCSAEVDGTVMTDQQICSFVGLLLIAGGETTDKAIASLMKNLIEHPAQMKAVRADRSLISNAMAETLRFSPPINIVLRTAEVDVEFEGGTIPSGSTVACVLGAANRDERKFTDPDSFNILRTDLDSDRAFAASSSHVTFGKGRHFCVGSYLAKAEVDIAVNKILDAMPTIAYAPNFTPVDTGLFTRAPESLIVQM